MFKNLIIVLSVLALSACKGYRPETMPKNSIVEKGTEISTTVKRDFVYIPHQKEPIYLKIDKILDRKVRDLLFEAKVYPSKDNKSLIIEANKMKVSAGTKHTTGKGKLPVNCGKAKIIDCGMIEIDSGTPVVIKLKYDLDLSGLVLTTYKDISK